MNWMFAELCDSEGVAMNAGKHLEKAGVHSKPIRQSLILIEAATAAIEHAMAVLANRSDPLSEDESTGIDCLVPQQRLAADPRNPAQEPDIAPELAAVNYCLESINALLAISQKILASSSDRTPLEKEQYWKDLAEGTKVAGRAAYHAALILSDPPAYQHSCTQSGAKPS